MLSTRVCFLCVAALCIEGALSLRNIGRESRTQNGGFGEALKQFDHRFHLVAELGFFSWYTNCSLAKQDSLRSCKGDVEINELRCGLGAGDYHPSIWRLPEASPARLVDVGAVRTKLPLAFLRSEPVLHPNRLPYEPPPVAALVAASKRFDLSKVDFYIGGSILPTLSSGAFGGKQFNVQKWRNMVMVLGYADYMKDLTQKGFQFERLLTGAPMGKVDRGAPHTEHIHVLRIGNFTVLASAEVDALDHEHRLVELKTVSRPNWNEIRLQMLASGSERFVHGITQNDTLTKVVEYDLRQLFGKTRVYERRKLAGNIIHALTTIRTLLGDKGEPFGLGKWNDKGSPTLVPLSTRERSMLPEARVLNQLFPGGGESLHDDKIPLRVRRKFKNWDVAFNLSSLSLDDYVWIS